MIKDIDNNILLIEDMVKWAEKYEKGSFPFERLKDYRRSLKKIKGALEEKCSAAAYGESQVGKSYLMSSLLSSPESPFMITNDGKSYSFIDMINPSGGNTLKVESTGVITRFTISDDRDKLPNKVRIRTLSVVDIILLITDSYYNDIKINPDTVLRYDAINKRLEELSSIWRVKACEQFVIQEDDIKNIGEYIKDVIGNNASNVYQSDFCKVISPVIQYIPFDKWVDVFGLLWNENAEMSHLFSILITEYKKLNFASEVYVPFEAVLAEYGTILKIEWLDHVFGITTKCRAGEKINTDVFDSNGTLIVRDFSKGNLSALIAEVTFFLPQKLAEDRPFLNKIDLLDFPGARSREKYKEQEIKTVLPQILRRGKVAYLFNKYSRSLQISSVLFCHHNDQKTEPTIGDTVNSWIEENIGSTVEKRAKMLERTDGIAPLFFIATKFNIDLERVKTDTPQNVEKLDSHWDRFNTVFPEIIKPNKWLDEWVKVGGKFKSPCFQNIYPLRDFYWSSKHKLFDGYSDGEKKSIEQCVHEYTDYPNYMDNLKDSFLRNAFVQKYFEDPEKTWNDVATINNDGSKAIIRNLNRIAVVLDEARKSKYLEQLNQIKEDLNNILSVYFEPEDVESNNKRVKSIIGKIRRELSLSVGTNPEIFGKIIDSLMISVRNIRSIAYDIIVCHIDTPKDFSQINIIRKTAGIDISDSKENNIDKLLKWAMCDRNELEEEYASKGISIDDIVSGRSDCLTTVADVVAKHIIDYWSEYINVHMTQLSEYLPHTDEIAFMLITLMNKSNIQNRIAKKIGIYENMFEEEELPNAIADYSSLILNNFVSSVGRAYIDEEGLESVMNKASACGLSLDFLNDGCAVVRKPQSIISALSALDDSKDIDTIDIEMLNKLPLWGGFQRWMNFLMIGLLDVSDVSHCNVEANSSLQKLIIQCNQLYS